MMAGGEKRPSAASNVKALLTQPEGLRFARKGMGLGDTLGALPVENGGTGCTDVDGIKKLVLQYPTDAELLEYLGLK